VYALTPRGEEHLSEWVAVLEHMSKSMTRLVMSARVELGKNDGRSKIQQRLAGAASGPA
jgi:DNA-binding PadR family transcriptional regulator